MGSPCLLPNGGQILRTRWSPERSRVSVPLRHATDEHREGCIYSDHAADLGFVPSARYGQKPLAHDLTGSESGLRRGSLSKTWVLETQEPGVESVSGMLKPLRPCLVGLGPIREWAGRGRDQSFCALQARTQGIPPGRSTKGILDRTLHLLGPERLPGATLAARPGGALDRAHLQNPVGLVHARRVPLVPHMRFASLTGTGIWSS